MKRLESQMNDKSAEYESKLREAKKKLEDSQNENKNVSQLSIYI